MDQERFEDMADMARMACAAPIVLIRLADGQRLLWGLEPPPADWGRELWDRIAARDRPLVCGDLFADRQLVGIMPSRPSIRSCLGVPLTWEGQSLGAFVILDGKPRLWSAETVASASRLARLTAGLIGLSELAGPRTGRSGPRLLADAAGEGDILSALTDGVVVHDASGQLIDANPAAARILGVSRDVLLGRKAADPRWRARTQSGEDLNADNHPTMQVVRTGRPVRDFIVSIEAPEAGRRWLRVNAEPLFGDGPKAPATGVVATFADVTSQTEAQSRQTALIADLENARQATAAGLEAAEAHSRAKSAFLANMSHELRTPLNGVVGTVDALARTTLDNRQRDMVRLVAESARSLERILSDVLDLSRIEAGKMGLETAPIRLDEVLASVCDLMRAKAVEKGLAFDVRIGPGLDRSFLGDAVRIRQVIANLLSNAIKFTNAGQVRVAVSAPARPGADGRTAVRIVVTDTGAGFTPEAAERLFERFEQADGSITRRFGGTGLGLAITRELVELMGGQIGAESEPGQGARFWVELPLAHAEASARPAPAESPSSSEALRILIAEDHPVNRQVIHLMLEPFGFDLTFAGDGREALEVLDNRGLGAFDVVLMDMQMPVMDGLTAIRRIRTYEQGASRLPIAMLSANAGQDHQTAALQAGADVHIAKPITLDSLLGGINQALESAPGRLAQAV